MQGVPEQFEFCTDRAEFRTVTCRPGVELYRAHIVRHSFEPHIHNAYGFGVIEQGVERFRYSGSEHLAPSNSIVLLNPDVLHTGRAETEAGWKYRMIYIEPLVLSNVMSEPSGWFPDAVVESDGDRARRMSMLLTAIWQAKEPVAFDSLLYQFG